MTLHSHAASHNQTCSLYCSGPCSRGSSVTAWPVSLQAVCLLTSPTDEISFASGCWPHHARFHFLCLVTQGGVSWNGCRYSVVNFT